MVAVKFENKTYTADPLHQWDVNQDLEIRGLSFTEAPEIHFTSVTMVRAVRVVSTVDAAGVIVARIPNGLLQSSDKIKAHICTREGDVFKTWYTVEIPVKARNKPADYTITDDQDIYSFVALENQVAEAVEGLTAAVEIINYAAEKAENAATVANGIAGVANEAKDTAAEAQNIATAAKTAADNAAAAAGKAQTSADAAKAIKLVVSLPAGGWVGDRQTVAAVGVTGGSLVIPGPDPAAENYAAYTENGVRCVGQASDVLTFSCEDVPAIDLTVNVAVFN